MRIFIVVLLFVSLTQSAWGATFRGKVIDADTKQPIEGAVVVVSWSEERATPAGPTSRLKDVKETLTDKNGMWTIEGPKGGNVGDIKAIFSFLTGTYFTNPPQFIVFKPSYCSWPVGFDIDACKRKIKPEGNNKVAEGVTVELPRATSREDRKHSLPSPFHKDGNGSFYSKQGAFIKLINEESRNLGLSEYDDLKRYEK
jgi:hypothetical protein